MKIIEKVKNFNYLLPITYFVFGLIMVIFPKTVTDVINYLVGGLLILFGINYIIIYLNNNKITKYSKYSLTIGIVPIICGVFLICNKVVIMSIIPFVAGMIILMDSFEKMKHAIDLKKLSYDQWWVELVTSVLFIVFGIIIILNPFEVTEMLIRILGIFFLVDCFIDVWTIFSYEKISIKTQNDAKIVVIDEKSSKNNWQTYIL